MNRAAAKRVERAVYRQVAALLDLGEAEGQEWPGRLAGLLNAALRLGFDEGRGADDALLRAHTMLQQSRVQIKAERLANVVDFAEARARLRARRTTKGLS